MEAKDGERDWEAEAKKEGWAPIEHWKGDPEDFKSAEQFVKDGEKIPAILKSKVERLEEERRKDQERQQELRQTTKQFKEFMEKSLERERQEKESLRKELRAARKQAIADGDGEAFERADSQLQDLSQTEAAPQGIDPLGQAWLEDNQWYATNDKLAAFADGIAERIVSQGYTGKAYFDELTKRTKDAFPDEFGNKNRSKPPPVESGGGPPPSSDERSFDNLPADAKAAYARFAKDIPGFSKDDYVANYDWE